MPLLGQNTASWEYPMASEGVNLAKSIAELRPDEAMISQNMIWKNGMVKRGGQRVVIAAAVVSGQPVLGLHRFYSSNASQTVTGANGIIKYLNGAAWTNIKTGLDTTAQMFFTTWQDDLYFANGVDASIKWSLSAGDTTLTAANAGTAGAILQFIGYQDRIVSIEANGDVTWSDSFDETAWNNVAATGVQVDSKLYGAINHSAQDTTTGVQSKILIAGANGMYLFAGTDLRTPSTTGNYVLQKVSDIACTAPRSMVWTPRGSMWLGADRQVYLLEFGSSTPVPAGDKIRAVRVGETGVESVTSTRMDEASAIYHDGYYKLSVGQGTVSNNQTQWWLDLNRVAKDEENRLGPWYGPMLGQEIGPMAVMNGSGDSGQLIGGMATSTGTVNFLHDPDDKADVSASISNIYRTYYNVIGDPAVQKEIPKIETELLDVVGTVGFTLHDITGAANTSVSVGLSGTGITFWNDLYWDEFFWTGNNPARVATSISPAVLVRRLAIDITFSSSTESFEIYGIRALATEQSVAYI